MKQILVTGCAGFIAFHVARRLLRDGHQVLGLDNLNPFYNEGLKEARLEILRRSSGFSFIKHNIADPAGLRALFSRHRFDWVAHFAAQPGVRHSLEDPGLYVQSNVVGFTNLIEEARRQDITHFVFASSSSVYGANSKMPFSESDNVDHPISVYAATKKANELTAHVYAHLYRLPVTGLRLFTVYGPWGRPDMALFQFCRAIFEGAPIRAYNCGRMLRDFTYIDDVVECVARVLPAPPAGTGGAVDQAADAPPYAIYNVGNSRPVEIGRLIGLLEHEIGKPARIESLPGQPGDVPATYADTSAFFAKFGYRAGTPIEDGVSRFVDWFRDYYYKQPGDASLRATSNVP